MALVVWVQVPFLTVNKWVYSLKVKRTAHDGHDVGSIPARLIYLFILNMYNNFYVKYNYRNIIPFNLKKKKLRVQANIIASKVAQSFFVGHQVKFWYYFFGINGLKRDNTILVKKFLNKRLSVFFISKFNMIEGKWGFPKIYEKYYKKNSYLKNKKFNLIKSKLILNKDSSDYNLSTLNYNHLKISNAFYNNTFYLNYIYSIKNVFFLKLSENILNSFNLFKFKKINKMPYLFIRAIKTRRKLKKDFDFNEKKKVYFRKKYKIAINSQGLLHIYKKKNILKNLINDSYILLKKKKIKNKMLQWRWNIFMKRSINFNKNLKKNISDLDTKINNNIAKHQIQQNRNRFQIQNKNKNVINIEKPIFDKKLYFKNKWFKEQKKLLEAEEFIKKKQQLLVKKKALLKFAAIKKIMNVVRLLKLFKELKKTTNNKTICYWFYKCFINFKFNNSLLKRSRKNKEEKKIRKFSRLFQKINKRISKQLSKNLIGKKKRRLIFLKILKGKVKKRIRFGKTKYSLLTKKNIYVQNNLINKNTILFNNILNYRNKKNKFFSNRIWDFNVVKKKKHKKILNWMIYLYSKLDKQFNKNVYINFILKFKKILTNLYKNKIVNKNYYGFDNNLFLGKTNVHYNFLGEIWNEYSNFSRIRRINLLKSKKIPILKKSSSFKKMHNFFKKKNKKFNIFSYLCRRHILLSGEDRILHKFKGSTYGKSLRKIWNTYLLKGKKLWSEEDFLLFTQNRKFFKRKVLNKKNVVRKQLKSNKVQIRKLPQNRQWERYMFNAGDLQNNFKISFLKRNKNFFNKKRKNLSSKI